MSVLVLSSISFLYLNISLYENFRVFGGGARVLLSHDNLFLSLRGFYQKRTVETHRFSLQSFQRIFESKTKSSSPTQIRIVLAPNTQICITTRTHIFSLDVYRVYLCLCWISERFDCVTRDDIDDDVFEKGKIQVKTHKNS